MPGRGRRRWSNAYIIRLLLATTAYIVWYAGQLETAIHSLGPEKSIRWTFNTRIAVTGAVLPLPALLQTFLGLAVDSVDGNPRHEVLQYVSVGCCLLGRILVFVGGSKPLQDMCKLNSYVLGLLLVFMQDKWIRQLPIVGALTFIENMQTAAEFRQGQIQNSAQVLGNLAACLAFNVFIVFLTPLLNVLVGFKFESATAVVAPKPNSRFSGDSNMPELSAAYKSKLVLERTLIAVLVASASLKHFQHVDSAVRAAESAAAISLSCVVSTSLLLNALLAHWGGRFYSKFATLINCIVTYVHLLSHLCLLSFDHGRINVLWIMFGFVGIHAHLIANQDCPLSYLAQSSLIFAVMIHMQQLTGVGTDPGHAFYQLHGPLYLASFLAYIAVYWFSRCTKWQDRTPDPPRRPSYPGSFAINSHNNTPQNTSTGMLGQELWNKRNRRPSEASNLGSTCNQRRGSLDSRKVSLDNRQALAGQDGGSSSRRVSDAASTRGLTISDTAAARRISDHSTRSPAASCRARTSAINIDIANSPNSPTNSPTMNSLNSMLNLAVSPGASATGPSPRNPGSGTSLSRMRTPDSTSNLGSQASAPGPLTSHTSGSTAGLLEPFDSLPMLSSLAHITGSLHASSLGMGLDTGLERLQVNGRPLPTSRLSAAGVFDSPMGTQVAASQPSLLELALHHKGPYLKQDAEHKSWASEVGTAWGMDQCTAAGRQRSHRKLKRRHSSVLEILFKGHCVTYAEPAELCHGQPRSVAGGEESAPGL